MTTLFATINIGRDISGDWIWYTQHYAVLEYTSIGEYLGTTYNGIASEPSEPIYYLIASAVSRLTGACVAALAASVTILIYVPLGVAAIVFVRLYTRNPMVVAVSVVASMSIGLTFTLSTQLVRQEIATSWLVLALALIAKGRPLPAALIMTLAALTHNSSMVASLAILVAYFASKLGRLPWWLVPAIGLAFAVLGTVFVMIGTESFAKDDGSVSALVLAFDVCAAAVVLALALTSPNSPTRVIALFYPAMFGFLAAVASEPLLSLRIYFFLEIGRALAIALFALWVLKRQKFRRIVAISVIAASLWYVHLRMSVSPFAYSRELTEVLLWPWLSGLVAQR
jgi:hypothetical protein